jgi:predicted nicotinamide N-methyase
VFTRRSLLSQALRVVTEHDAAARDPTIRSKRRFLDARHAREVTSETHDGSHGDEQGGAVDTLALEADGSWSGGSIWDSAELLAQVLIEKPPQYWSDHKRVIELGAGCALSGLSAAAMGAPHVVLTDQIVHMAQHNLDANFQPGTAERERVSVRVLRWGSPDDIASVLSLRTAAGIGAASTARDDEEAVAEEKEAAVAGSALAAVAPYDLILGSDCIYHREHHERLASTIDALAGPRTTVLW